MKPPMMINLRDEDLRMIMGIAARFADFNNYSGPDWVNCVQAIQYALGHVHLGPTPLDLDAFAAAPDQQLIEAVGTIIMNVDADTGQLPPGFIPPFARYPSTPAQEPRMNTTPQTTDPRIELAVTLSKDVADRLAAAGSDDAAATPAAPYKSNGRLRMHVEAIERIDDDIDDLKGDRKDRFTLAKSEGYDPKVLRAVLRRRKTTPAERDAFDEMIDLYEAEIAQPSLPLTDARAGHDA